jgi:hypothetical protein
MLHSRQNVTARTICVAMSVFVILTAQLAPAQQWTCHDQNGIPWEGEHGVEHDTYIDADHVAGPTPCVYPPPTGISLIYKGDPGAVPPTYGPIQSARTYSDAGFSAHWNFTLFTPDVGRTTNYATPSSPVNGSTLSALDDDNVLNDCYRRNNYGYADKSNMHGQITLYATNATARLYGSASNPLEMISPSIKWDSTTLVDWSNLDYVTAKVTSVTHSCFPNHIIYENDVILYHYHSPRTDLDWITYCLTGFGSITGPTQPTIHVPCN